MGIANTLAPMFRDTYREAPPVIRNADAAALDSLVQTALLAQTAARMRVAPPERPNAFTVIAIADACANIADSIAHHWQNGGDAESVYHVLREGASGIADATAAWHSTSLGDSIALTIAKHSRRASYVWNAAEALRAFMAADSEWDATAAGTYGGSNWGRVRAARAAANADVCAVIANAADALRVPREGSADSGTEWFSADYWHGPLCTDAAYSTHRYAEALAREWAALAMEAMQRAAALPARKRLRHWEACGRSAADASATNARAVRGIHDVTAARRCAVCAITAAAYMCAVALTDESAPSTAPLW